MLIGCWERCEALTRINKNDLQLALASEVKAWSGKSYDTLVHELREPRRYSSDAGSGKYATEVRLLETSYYVRVRVRVHDGSMWGAMTALFATFSVSRDGPVGNFQAASSCPVTSQEPVARE